MEVNHGLPQIGMAQQKLDGAQIGSVFEQVRREAMTERVGMKRLVHAGALGGLAAGVPDHLVANRIIGRVVPSSREQPHGGLPGQAAIMLS